MNDRECFDIAQYYCDEANLNGLPDDADFWRSITELFRKDEVKANLDQLEIAISRCQQKIIVYNQMIETRNRGGVLWDNIMINKRNARFLMSRLEKLRTNILKPKDKYKSNSKKKPA